MVWFHCDDCGDSLKKPKLATHLCRCSASKLTCLDCNRTFSQSGAQSHTSCVTEHEKYALGLTKLGTGGQTVKQTSCDQPPAAGLDFLSERPPWQCRLCNVNCTSRDTLLGHAAGVKHIRRVKARQKQSAEEAGNANANAAPALKVKRPLTDEVGNLIKKRPAGTVDLKPASVEQPPCRAAKQQKVRGGCSTLAEATDQAPAEQAAAVVLPATRCIKWKKLASAELRQSGKLSLAKLQARVFKAAFVPLSRGLKSEFRQRLQSSSKFVFDNGLVSLRE